MVQLIWATPQGDSLVAKLARVSNPGNENNIETAPKLISYLIRNKHWSPFEMVSACFEINTTRDIARQILRHRSFSFQEFSQRYADVSALEAEFKTKECRFQDTKNRQNSLSVDPSDNVTIEWWENTQKNAWRDAIWAYKSALQIGIAKEVARVVLPEGLTPSRLYMSGTLRSWIHYLQLRLKPGTQKEHQEVALEIHAQLSEAFPDTMKATTEGT